MREDIYSILEIKPSLDRGFGHHTAREHQVEFVKEDTGVFRTLIVLNQLLVCGVIIVHSATGVLHTATDALRVAAEASVMDEPSHVILSKVSYFGFYITFIAAPFLSLVASVGLFVFRKWGRVFFLVYFGAALLLAIANLSYFYSLYLSPLLTRTFERGASLLEMATIYDLEISFHYSLVVSYLSAVTGVLILAFLYFSPVKKLFEQ